jgi:hypothetical protein
VGDDQTGCRLSDDDIFVIPKTRHSLLPAGNIVMKYLSIALLLGLFCQTASGEEPPALRVHCVYYTDSQLEAEIGVVSMAQSMSRNATQGELTTSQGMTDDGTKYWVARMTITVPSSELKEFPPKPEPRASAQKD